MTITNEDQLEHDEPKGRFLQSESQHLNWKTHVHQIINIRLNIMAQATRKAMSIDAGLEEGGSFKKVPAEARPVDWRETVGPNRCYVLGGTISLAFSQMIFRILSVI